MKGAEATAEQLHSGLCCHNLRGVMELAEVGNGLLPARVQGEDAAATPRAHLGSRFRVCICSRRSRDHRRRSSHHQCNSRARSDPRTCCCRRTWALAVVMAAGMVRAEALAAPNKTWLRCRAPSISYLTSSNSTPQPRSRMGTCSKDAVHSHKRVPGPPRWCMRGQDWCTHKPRRLARTVDPVARLGGMHPHIVDHSLCSRSRTHSRCTRSLHRHPRRIHCCGTNTFRQCIRHCRCKT